MTNRKCGRNTDVTFGTGNPGKPKGTRHKATQAALALLDGEAEALTRQAVTMALDGDGAALRLCLERIAPPRRDAPVTFDLPRMETARDAAKAAGAVLEAVALGDLTPTEGRARHGAGGNLPAHAGNNRTGSPHGGAGRWAGMTGLRGRIARLEGRETPCSPAERDDWLCAKLARMESVVVASGDATDNPDASPMQRTVARYLRGDADMADALRDLVAGRFP